MILLCAFWLFAPAANLPPTETTKTANSSITHPVFIDTPRNPNGLTLYNEKGEAVARCEKKDDTFHDCKIKQGVTLDQLMNAWVHAYLEVQK